MLIEKGVKYVCVVSKNGFIKGNVYIADGGHIPEHFIKYNDLDCVYTNYTEELYRLHCEYHRITPSDNDIAYFDNASTEHTTGHFSRFSGYEDYYLKNNYTYLSEAAFIEFMGLEQKSDVVNNPSHYNKGGIECIDAIESSMTKEAFLGYLKGNVQKYLYRYESKENPLQDVKKAEWYLKKLIEKLADNKS